MRSYEVRRHSSGPTRRPNGPSKPVREEFTGLMLPLIRRSMPDLQSSFEAFADGLALATESAR